MRMRFISWEQNGGPSSNGYFHETFPVACFCVQTECRYFELQEEDWEADVSCGEDFSFLLDSHATSNLYQRKHFLVIRDRCTNYFLTFHVAICTLKLAVPCRIESEEEQKLDFGAFLYDVCVVKRNPASTHLLSGNFLTQVQPGFNPGWLILHDKKM